MRLPHALQWLCNHGAHKNGSGLQHDHPILNICNFDLIESSHLKTSGWSLRWMDGWMNGCHLSILGCSVLFCRRATELLMNYHCFTSHFHLDCLTKWMGYQEGNCCTANVRNVGQDKWCARWRNEGRWQEDYIVRRSHFHWKSAKCDQLIKLFSSQDL